MISVLFCFVLGFLKLEGDGHCQMSTAEGLDLAQGFQARVIFALQGAFGNAWRQLCCCRWRKVGGSGGFQHLASRESRKPVKHLTVHRMVPPTRKCGVRCQWCQG